MKKWIYVMIGVLLTAIATAAICFIVLNIKHNNEPSYSETETITEESETTAPTETESESETVCETETETEEALIGTGHKVCLDPGHQSFSVDMSGTEPNGPGSSEMKTRATTGTAGRYTGVAENELVLTIGLSLKAELETRGYEVVMTREDGMTAISNKERAELAASSGSDIFVRIHADGNDDPSVNGAMTMIPSPQNPYVSYLYEDSYKLGECIINAYCESTGMKNNGVNCYDNQTGINWSRVPVTIIEMGFMSNQTDDVNMQDPDYQTQMVTGIANGIDLYFMQQEEAETETQAVETETAVVETEIQTESPVETEYQADTEAETPEAAVNLNAMDSAKSAIEGLISSGTYISDRWSVCLMRCSTGEVWNIGNGRQQAASLIKLYIMGAVYEQYDALAALVGTDRLNQLLYSMITVSDNDSANELTRYLGNGDEAAGQGVVNTYCQNHGYTSTSMGRMLLAPATYGDNYTSAADCAAFLNQAVAGQLAGSESMISLLKQQQRTGKIPAGIPAGVVTANKTGELLDVENDAAIIYADSGVYILTVMSENLVDAGNARSVISQMASLSYNYLGSE